MNELTQEDTEGFHGGALAEALKMMRRECAGSTERIEGEMHHGRWGVDERELLALRRG